MCSRDTTLLDKMFQLKVRNIVKDCDKKGVNLLVYCTLRTPQEQAKLWRQSRSLSDINKTCDRLVKDGYKIIADFIKDVGPQNGPHVTNAIPGKSWHQFGYAVDCVPLINKKAEWNNSHPHWKIFGDVAKFHGCFWGGDWESFRDYPHIQFHPNSPFDEYPKQEIINRLKKFL